MPNVVTCSCGQSFRAKPELAGKRVNCPSCGSVLQIPQFAPPPEAPIKGRSDLTSIPVTCSCGQSFRAKPELAGKRVKCPTCGSVLQIPQSAQPAPPLDAPDDPLGLGGFNEQAMGAPLPQMPASQPLQTALPSYSAPKPRRDWGPIIRIGLIGGGVVIGIGVLVAGAMILWTFLTTHRTPESVFQAAMGAAKRQDWEDLCQCLTPESRDQIAGALLDGAVSLKGFSDMAVVDKPEKAQEVEEKLKPLMDTLAKHGIDVSTLDTLIVNTLGHGRLQALAPIKDRNRFVADMIAALQRIDDKAKHAPFPMESDATLENLEINGDSATGRVCYTRNDVKLAKRIKFKKVDGSWKIDLPRSGRL